MNQCCIIIKELRSMLKKRRGWLLSRGSHPIDHHLSHSRLRGKLLLCELSEFAWTIVMVRFLKSSSCTLVLDNPSPPKTKKQQWYVDTPNSFSLFSIHSMDQCSTFSFQTIVHLFCSICIPTRVLYIVEYATSISHRRPILIDSSIVSR